MKTNRLNVPVTIQWEGKTNRKHFLKYLIEKNNFKTMAEVGVRDGQNYFSSIRPYSRFNHLRY
jgi:hypothetical protein